MNWKKGEQQQLEGLGLMMTSCHLLCLNWHCVGLRIAVLLLCTELLRKEGFLSLTVRENMLYVDCLFC